MCLSLLQISRIQCSTPKNLWSCLTAVGLSTFQTGSCRFGLRLWLRESFCQDEHHHSALPANLNSRTEPFQWYWNKYWTEEVKNKLKKKKSQNKISKPLHEVFLFKWLNIWSKVFHRFAQWWLCNGSSVRKTTITSQCNCPESTRNI